MQEKQQTSGKNTADPEITFNYIKSPHFRVIHVDGAIGGITPNKLIYLSAYNERPAIPQQTTHILKPDGTLGAEIPEKKVSRPGFVRELEVNLLMDRTTALAVRDWITERVQEIDNLKAKGD